MKSFLVSIILYSLITPHLYGKDSKKVESQSTEEAKAEYKVGDEFPGIGKVIEAKTVKDDGVDTLYLKVKSDSGSVFEISLKTKK